MMAVRTTDSRVSITVLGQLGLTFLEDLRCLVLVFGMLFVVSSVSWNLPRTFADDCYCWLEIRLALIIRVMLA